MLSSFGHEPPSGLRVTPYVGVRQTGGSSQGQAVIVDAQKKAMEARDPELAPRLAKLSQFWASYDKVSKELEKLGADETSAETITQVLKLLGDTPKLTMIEEVEKSLEQPSRLLTTEQSKSLSESISAMKETAVILGRLKEALSQIGAFSPAAPVMAAPKVIELPIGDARNTYLDLRNTTVREGDTIRIKASLLNGETEVDHSEATFRVARYGWQQSFAPSVALARPDVGPNGTTKFRFAPFVAWMHTWVPRNECNPLNVVQPGLGIHAGFLSYATGDANEVGLGLAGSFWKDKLIFGIGGNLAASRSHRKYYFVGSSLIALLQAAGVGESK